MAAGLSQFQILSHFTDFTGYVLFIITSFLAGVESADQSLLNSKVLSCFSGVIMSIRLFFLLGSKEVLLLAKNLNLFLSVTKSHYWHKWQTNT